MKNVICFLVTFLILASASRGQKVNQNHKLLWKITGNGLQTPSYLYGTMHIRDKRAFNFSDSLYLKIDECKHFALEVHPDSIIEKFIVKSIQKGIQSQYNKEFGEDLNFGENKLESKNFKVKSKKEKLFLEKYYFTRNDKNTFVDAHLYHIARVRNKQIQGLENVKSQMEHMEKLDFGDELPSEVRGNNGKIDNKAMMTTMIANYKDGLFDEFSFLALDSMIQVRNQIMYESSLKYLDDGGIFMAVGVGHLGGEKGLIQKYKDAGYKIEPVKAIFTKLTEKLGWENLEMPWIKHDFIDEGISFETPSLSYKAQPNDLAGYLNSNLCPDIGTGHYFMSFAMPTILLKDEKEYLSNFQDKNSKIKKSKISYEGLDGSLYEITNLLFKGQIRVLQSKTKLYIQTVVCESKQNLDQKSVDKFFKSHKFKETIVTSDQKIYHDTLFNFSFDTEITPKENRVIDGDVINYQSVFLDYKNDILYIISTVIMPPNSTRLSDIYNLNFFNTLFADSQEKEIKILQGENKNGYEYQVKKDGYNTIGHLFIKGTNIYEISGVTQASDKKEIMLNKINTFTFDNTKTSRQVSHQFDHFKIKAPTYKDESIDSSFYKNWKVRVKKYHFKDSLNGDQYLVEEYDVNPCYTITSKDSMLSFVKNNLLNFNDSLVYMSSTADAYEYQTINKPETINQIKHQIRLCGDKLYHLEIVYALGKNDTSHISNFFTSFQLNKACESSNFIADTSFIKKIIVQKIMSRDSLALSQAMAYFNDYSFSKDVLPSLAIVADSLLSQTAYDASEYVENLINYLFYHNYGAKLEVIKKVLAAKKIKPSTISSIVKNLLETRDSLNFLLLKELINKDKSNLTKDNGFDPFYYFAYSDSTALLKWLFPDFKSWVIQDSSIALVNTVLVMFENKLISANEFSELRNRLEIELSMMLAKYEKQKEDPEADALIYPSEIVTILKLASYYSPMVSKFQAGIELLLKDQSYYNQVEAIDLILKTKQPIKFKKQLNSLIKNRSAKKYLYGLNNLYPSAKLLPAHELNRDSFVMAYIDFTIKEVEEYYEYSNLQKLKVEQIGTKYVYTVKFNGYEDETQYGIFVFDDSVYSFEKTAKEEVYYNMAYHYSDEKEALKKLKTEWEESLLKK